MEIKTRTKSKEFLDFIMFPFRAFFLIMDDRWGLSSLRSDRFYYVAKEIKGFCLDIGCGPNNIFIGKFLNNNGVGIDVFEYEGLTGENIIKDLSQIPFNDEKFTSVTFIANINHIPKRLRDIELKEAFRVLKNNGNIIVTMGNPIAELLAHLVIWISDTVFKTKVDFDTERGMDDEEDYYLTGKEIITRLKIAGFSKINRKYFFTQWGLNSLFLGWKESK